MYKGNREKKGGWKKGKDKAVKEGGDLRRKMRKMGGGKMLGGKWEERSELKEGLV